MITIYDTDELEALRRRAAVQPHGMKRFRNALFKKGQCWEDALATLPEAAHGLFADHVQGDCLKLAERHDSAVDGASKLIFRTQDGHLIESVVLRPKTGRTSICISSQVGCACGCSFCATGKMGFSRNLTKAEVLDQVTQANRLLRSEERIIRNVVFMGMGEPLLNPDHVFEAVEFLTAVPFFNLSGARITVSTVGIPEAMTRLTEAFPSVRLALSLHSARQEVREQLMPFARRYPLNHLREALVDISHNGTVMIEYLMLSGVNDAPEDLEALKRYLDGIPAHINIIPFNEHEGCELQGTSRPAREQFANELKAAGFDVTLRYSLGSDIEAACGQLVKNHKKERIGGTG